MFSLPFTRIKDADGAMSITIMGHPGGTIRVSGDIETVLIAPCVKRGQPFVLGFSDGKRTETFIQRLLFRESRSGKGGPAFCGCKGNYDPN